MTRQNPGAKTPPARSGTRPRLSNCRGSLLVQATMPITGVLQNIFEHGGHLGGAERDVVGIHVVRPSGLMGLREFSQQQVLHRGGRVVHCLPRRSNGAGIHD